MPQIVSMSLELCVSSDGHTAQLSVEPPNRVHPGARLSPFGPLGEAQDQPRAVVELPVKGTSERTFVLGIR